MRVSFVGLVSSVGTATVLGGPFGAHLGQHADVGAPAGERRR
jgi:hypothetical protein